MLGMHFWSWGMRTEILYAHCMELLILRSVIPYVNLEWNSIPLTQTLPSPLARYKCLNIKMCETQIIIRITWFLSLFILLTLGICILPSVIIWFNESNSYIQHEKAWWILVWLSRGGKIGIFVQYSVKGKTLEFNLAIRTLVNFSL